MSHCHDEHAGHSHGGHDHADHDHSDDITPVRQFSLYQHIDFDNVTALNEGTHGSAKAITKKTWDERLTDEPLLRSDADAQIIVNVPFTGQIKLHSLLLRTSSLPTAPRTLHVYINRDDLDFSALESSSPTPTQTFELSQTSGIQDLPVKRAKFAAVRRLTLFFEDNFAGGGEDESGDEVMTEIGYLGFKGEWMQLGRAPVNILYEAAANPGDHKLKGVGVNGVGSGIGGGT